MWREAKTQLLNETILFKKIIELVNKLSISCDLISSDPSLDGYVKDV